MPSSCCWCCWCYCCSPEALGFRAGPPAAAPCHCTPSPPSTHTFPSPGPTHYRVQLSPSVFLPGDPPFLLGARRPSPTAGEGDVAVSLALVQFGLFCLFRCRTFPTTALRSARCMRRPSSKALCPVRPSVLGRRSGRSAFGRPWVDMSGDASAGRGGGLRGRFTHTTHA